jgi:hypothetical protein
MGQSKWLIATPQKKTKKKGKKRRKSNFRK